MKADARAPATTSPKIASGILNDARYASRSGVSPKCAPMTDSRSQPSTRLATRVTIMIAEARAIDIGNTLILRHQVSFAPNAGKETQALSAEAHPPDAAAHLNADDRPLRGAYRSARGARSPQLALDLVQMLLTMDRARQVERRRAGRADLREHPVAERLDLSVRLLREP